MESYTPTSTSSIPIQPIILDDDDQITPAPPTSHPSPTTDLDLDPDDLSQPFLDIHDLFTQYNRKHFNNAIQNTYVEYSTRMTLCAGTCTFKGPLGGCRIALSEPLLKFRPRADLRSTLLHEMIHAFLFETEGVAVRDGVDGHGPKFMYHAERINRTERGKVNITPYHTFKDEVDLYRVHHWTCNLCAMVIKRAMNRAPAPHDPFWPLHEKSCGGEFVKTKEPEKKKVVKKKAPKNKVVAVDPSSKSNTKLPPGVMRTLRIDSMLKGKAPRRPINDMVACPSCNTKVPKVNLNNHLDTCLTPAIFQGDSDEIVCIPPSDEEPEILSPLQRKDIGKQQISSENDALSRSDDKKSGQYVQSLTRSIGADSISKRPRTETAVLKDIIPNSDLLMAYAINPYSVAQESLNSLVREASPDKPIPISKNVSTDIVSVLKDKTRNRNTPHDMQRRARAQIRRYLNRDSKIIDISDGESEENTSSDAERISKRIKLEAQTGKDGVHLQAKEVLRLIGIDPEPLLFLGSTQVEPKSGKRGGITPVHKDQSQESKIEQHRKRQSSSVHTEHKANPTVTNLNDDSVEMVDVQPEATAVCTVCNVSVLKEKLDQHVSKCLSRTRGINSVKEDLPGSTKPRAVGNCPVCDRSIPRNQLEEHVNQCLHDADMASLLFSTEQDLEADASTGSDPRREIKQLQNRTEKANSSSSRCPVCDLAMPRDKLETHVSRCMLSSGLGDAF